MCPLSKTQAQGQAIEREAELYLNRQGLTSVTRNYRCKAGEIDLIMRQGEILVFVEVRYRHNARYGDGAATVTRHKQQRLIRTAQHYLVSHNLYDSPCRFDVVAAQQAAQARSISFDWIQNAIETT